MTGVQVDRSCTASFSEHAIQELESVLEDYSSSIIAECNRLVDGKDSARPPEITAATVKKANDVFKLSRDLGKLKRPPLWLRIGSTALPVITGVFPSFFDIKDPPYSLTLGALLLASVGLLVAVSMEDYSK